MTRARTGTARLKWKRRQLKRAKGFRGGRGNLHKQLVTTIRRAGKFATRDRKDRKGDFRSIWIIRLNAAVRAKGLTYSKFMGALSKTGIVLNRKQLSEIAIHDPAGFDQIVELVRKAS